MHSFQDLLDNMPASIAELSRLAGVSERSIIRARDGEAIQRSTANKILRGLSHLYSQTFTLNNVTGFTLASRDDKDE